MDFSLSCLIRTVHIYLYCPLLVFHVEGIKENCRTVARRMNIELEILYKVVNIATFIKLQRDIHKGWKMQENTKKIYQADLHQKRR